MLIVVVDSVVVVVVDVVFARCKIMRACVGLCGPKKNQNCRILDRMVQFTTVKHGPKNEKPFHEIEEFRPLCPTSYVNRPHNCPKKIGKFNLS